MSRAILVVTIAALLSHAIAEARPSQPLKHGTRELTFCEGHCETVARAADEALNFYSREGHQSLEVLRDYSERFLGINLFNPDVMHTTICRLSEATTLSDLKAALDDLGLTLNAATTAYNFLAASVPIMKYNYEHIVSGIRPDSPEEWHYYMAFYTTLQMLYASPLVALDPDGTRWIIDNYAYYNILEDEDWPRHNTPDNVDYEALWKDLMEQINTLLDLAVFGSDYENTIVSQVESMSGVDLRNEEVFGNITRSIVEATNIPRLLEVLESTGIFDRFFVYLYNTGVSSVESWTAYYDYESDYNQFNSYYLEKKEREKDARGDVYVPLMNGLADLGLFTLEDDLTERRESQST